MAELPDFRPDSRAAWRRWLEAHHADSPGVWLVYAKKGTGVPTISYEESVVEALCFGWIDGLMRSLDDRFYKRRFTPRRPGGTWSESNKRRLGELEGTGLMTPAGRRVVEEAQADGSYDRPTDAVRTRPVTDPTPEFQAALDAHPRAKAAYESLTPGRRRTYCRWIAAAKREATREKRIAEALASLEEGKELG